MTPEEIKIVSDVLTEYVKAKAKAITGKEQDNLIG